MLLKKKKKDLKHIKYIKHVKLTTDIKNLYILQDEKKA